MFLILAASERCMFQNSGQYKAFCLTNSCMTEPWYSCLELELDPSPIGIGSKFLSIWLYKHWELYNDIHIFGNTEGHKLHVII